MASDTVGTWYQAMLRHVVTGLAPATVYYASLSTTDPTKGSGPTWQGDPVRFRTFPDPTATGTEVKWAFGSCQYFSGHPDIPRQSDGVTALQTAWTDLRGWQRHGGDRVGPDLLWDVGDFHYQGGNSHGQYGPKDPPEPLTYARMYWQQIRGVAEDDTTGLTEMRLARALMLEDQVSDDHGFSANNGDSGGGGYDTDARKAQITASTSLFAMYRLAGNSGDTPGMYGTYMLTQNARVIVLDAESTARAPQRQGPFPQPPTPGDFLGEAQTDWLFNHVLSTPVTLNIIVCGKSYPGELTTDADENPVVDANDVDKTWAYRTWREGFAAQIAALRAQGQGFLWIGGDRHKIGYMPKENNPHGGFACLVGSGWSQHYLTPVPGEVPVDSNAFSILYEGFDAGDSYGSQVMQYLRGTVTDNGPDDVTVSVEMRYLKPPNPSPVPAPRWQWPMATLATVTIQFPES